MSDAQLRELPEGATCVTNAILTSGNRIRQGWRLGSRHFETFHYPGALNYSEIVELAGVPPWSPLMRDEDEGRDEHDRQEAR